VLVGIRVMLEMLSGSYALFFNVPVFLVFAIVVARVVAYGARSLDEQRRHLLVAFMLGAETVLLVVGLIHDSTC